MAAGLLSGDMCFIVVLWCGFILACILAGVDVFWCLICVCALSCLWFCLCWLYLSGMDILVNLNIYRVCQKKRPLF